jgi:hypothetical protein
METLRSPHVAGRKFRMHWMVQAGMQLTEDYVFHVDGSMSYARADNGKQAFRTLAQYGALEIAPDIVLVSFMDNEGRTLSFAMNFADGRAQGFSSLGAKWTPIQGRFEAMSKDRARPAMEAAAA